MSEMRSETKIELKKVVSAVVESYPFTTESKLGFYLDRVEEALCYKMGKEQLLQAVDLLIKKIPISYNEKYYNNFVATTNLLMENYKNPTYSLIKPDMENTLHRKLNILEKFLVTRELIKNRADPKYDPISPDVLQEILVLIQHVDPKHISIQASKILGRKPTQKDMNEVYFYLICKTRSKEVWANWEGPNITYKDIWDCYYSKKDVPMTQACLDLMSQSKTSRQRFLHGSEKLMVSKVLHDNKKYEDGKYERFLKDLRQKEKKKNRK